MFCPKCNSINTAQTKAIIEGENNTCQAFYHCDKCGFDWYRNYTFEGAYTIVEETVRLEGENA